MGDKQPSLTSAFCYDSLQTTDSSRSKLVVIIMAGGLGKRMNSDLPKVLHKIQNEPMLIHVIKQAKKLLPTTILIVVGKYRKIIEETIKEYIGASRSEKRLNSVTSYKEFDLENIRFIVQHEPLGTGHAIQCCIHELLKLEYPQSDTTVLILSGDVPLLQANTMIDIVSNLNGVKIAVTSFDDPCGYGRIVEKDNIFDKIVEEKDCDVERKNIKKVNCGIYAFNSALLCKYLPLLQPNNSQGEYYLTDIVEIIKTQENIRIEMLEFSKDKQIEIIGVNTAEQLYELEKRVNSSD